jgi:hypothetical protein
MVNEFQPSVEYADFFFLAIDHACGSIEDGGGPLIPFVMTVNSDGEKQLQRFVTERLEDGLKHAREYVDVNQDKLDMYAIAWDGYVTIDDERTDAVFVEAGERNDSLGVIFCQRYREVKRGLLQRKKFESIGNPVLIERPEIRFKSIGD